jgi:serine/threonine protein kinase
MRLSNIVLIVPLGFFGGCKDKAKKDNGNQDGEQNPNWSEIPTKFRKDDKNEIRHPGHIGVEAFSNSLTSQKKIYESGAVKNGAHCPPNIFRVDSRYMWTESILYQTFGVQIYRLVDPMKLFKVASVSMDDMSGIWNEKAAMAALRATSHANISPAIEEDDLVSDLEKGCKVRSMVVDFVEGQSLSKLVPGALSISKILEIGRLAIKALESVHAAGIIHGDIHRGNIMYDQVTNELKIIDYGRAKPYLTLQGDHIPFQRVPLNPRWNTLLLSIGELSSSEVSRADDLFRLAETLVTMIQGFGDLLDFGVNLPDTDKLIQKKKTRRFAAKVPQGLCDFYRATVNMKFSEQPDYNKLVAMLA